MHINKGLGDTQDIPDTQPLSTENNDLTLFIKNNWEHLAVGILGLVIIRKLIDTSKNVKKRVISNRMKRKGARKRLESARKQLENTPFF